MLGSVYLQGTLKRCSPLIYDFPELPTLPTEIRSMTSIYFYPGKVQASNLGKLTKPWKRVNYSMGNFLSTIHWRV